MCGISGIINKSYNSVEKQEIKRINDLISHRGPDDEGFYYENNFAFGHRRLSIIDLSSAGHQPMHYMDKYVITYNGEVYNYLEIKEELEEYGYKFSSNTDTEVIIASYDKWGEDCVNKFNGMWAFALYDKQKEIIFCSRDRFGVKPFYYTEVDNKFIFGSEIKQLLEFYENRYVNKNIAIEFLRFRLLDHTNETFFENIFKLEQSHSLIYNLKTNKFNIKKYFDIKLDDSLMKMTEKQTVEYLNQKLQKAVELRLRSDVKVGTCLSGGIDSSAIASIASKKYCHLQNSKFMAIHAKSVEERTDESNFAKDVANFCNLDMDIVEPAIEEIIENIEKVAYVQEEPYGGPSIYMQYFVMKEAKEKGCIVMLDGQGADEIFFGYENYLHFYFIMLLSRFKLFKFFKEIKSVSNAKLNKKSLFNDIKLRVLRKLFNFPKYDKKFINYPIDMKRLEYLFKIENFQNFQKREVMIKNLPKLLKCEDRSSMWHSVETRLPYVDYEFLQSVLSINPNFKYKNGYLKYILREMIGGLIPKNVIWRKDKFGFEAPIDILTKKHKNVMFDVIKESHILNYLIDISNIEAINNGLLWRLYNVAIWERVYSVKIKL